MLVWASRGSLDRLGKTAACTHRQNSQPPRKRPWRLLFSAGFSSAGRSCSSSAAGISTGTGRAPLARQQAPAGAPLGELHRGASVGSRCPGPGSPDTLVNKAIMPRPLRRS